MLGSGKDFYLKPGQTRKKPDTPDKKSSTP
jgi:hypothetical protein